MNGNIFTSENEQAELLNQIMAIGQAIQQDIASRPQAVYQLIVDATCRITGADVAVLYPYHPSFGEFYDTANVAACGLRHPLQLPEKADKRKGLAARIHRRGELICEDTTEEEPQVKETPFIVREEIKAFMGMSLTMGENIIGILYVDYREAHPFSQEEKQIIRLFGQQAATAVSNSWTHRLAEIRAESMTKLKTIGRRLAEVGDPSQKSLDDVLKEIAHSASEVLDADMVDLYQYIQSRRQFILPPILVGERRHPHLIPTRVHDEDVVTRAVKLGQPQYFENSQKAMPLIGDLETPRIDLPEKFVIREEVASSAIIPLKTAEETVGVMFVNYRTSQFFGPGQRDVIESFAAQAAIAIHNNRLFNETLRQRNELQIVDEIGQLLMSTRDPGAIPHLLIRQIIRLFKVAGASMWQVHQAARQVRCLFSLNHLGQNEPFTTIIKEIPFQFGEGIVGTVAESGRPMIVNRVQEEPRWDERIDTATAFETKSLLAVPLIHKQEVIGVIELLNRLDGSPFTEKDRDFLMAIVSPAAVAFDNARLYQDLERRVEALTALNDVGETLTTSSLLEEDQILTLVHEYAAKLTGAENIIIARYDDSQELIRFGPVIEAGQPATYESRQANLARPGKTEEVILTKRPLLLSTHQAIEQWHKLPEHRPLDDQPPATWLGVPLLAGEKVLGVLAVYDREQELAFDEQHLQTLDSMTDQAAMALYNANLYRSLTEAYQDLRRRVEALSILNQVGQTLTSGIRLEEEEVLELIHDQVQKLTGAQEMYIALYDEVANIIRFGLAIEKGERIIIKPRQANLEQRGQTEDIIFTKEPVLHKTKQDLEAWYKQPGHQEFRGDVASSWMGVPMVVGNRVLGVIAVYNWDREGAYDELDLQVLDSMGQQAAIALQNANLYHQLTEDNLTLVRRTQALNALSEVGQKLTSGIRLEEEQILELIYEQVRQLTGAYELYIALYEDESQTISFGLAIEKGERVEIPSRQANMKQRGQTEDIIFTETSVLHNTKAELETWYKQPGRQEFRGDVASSWMGVPIMSGAKVLGVIAVYDWAREYAYDDQDLQVLDAIADQAGIALDNARLYQALQRRVEALSTLNKIGRELTSELRLSEAEIIELIFEQTRRLTGTQNIYIAFYNDKTNMVNFKLLMEKGERLEPETEPGFTSRPIDVANRGKTDEVILTRKSILHASRAEEAAWYSRPNHREYAGEYAASHLAVPMVIGQRVIGVIAIYDWDQEKAYDEQDLQILSSMANQAAIALENVRLYAATRAELLAARELATLGTVTAAIQHRINNSLNLIRPNITRLKQRVDTSDQTIQEILDIMERNTKYTSDYINRIQEPLKETEVQLVDLNASLRDVQGQVRSEYQDRAEIGTVTVLYELDESLPLIEASLGQISEIFRNLIENSYKAMGVKGGRLTLVSRQTKGWLEIEIRDSGPGIPPEVRDKLFTKPVPSTQAADQRQGTGLGLWLSALLLQKYAGQIEIASTGPEGTAMVIRLPRPDSEKEA